MEELISSSLVEKTEFEDYKVLIQKQIDLVNRECVRIETRQINYADDLSKTHRSLQQDFKVHGKQTHEFKDKLDDL